MDPVSIDPARPKVAPAAGSATDPGQPASAAPQSGADAVTLSSDLQLAERAVRAALEGAESNVAARIRGLEENGTRPVDLDRLADRMIDAVLHSYDDRT
jgi:hypothetical protein